SAAWITRGVENTLRRLQTDYIELYQAHRDDPATPIEETLRAFAGLIEQGKIRAIGASNFTADRLAESLQTSRRLSLPRYESLQPHYNLMERAAYESDLEPLCLKEEVGVINYYALAAGFLTGKYRSDADLSKSPRGTGAGQYLDARGLRVLAALDEVAARHGVKPAQVALAWLMARPSVTAPIASATNVEQLAELTAAAQLHLETQDIEALNAASGGQS
ncbi:MAG: aldo/keto reductase, partial [Pseudomonadota bacterium]|nr:aldo/keto reductase [Pseudomonadota bacterium]